MLINKELAISEIQVEVNLFQKIENQETTTYIERKIVFQYQLDQEIQQRLKRVAENAIEKQSMSDFT